MTRATENDGERESHHSRNAAMLRAAGTAEFRAIRLGGAIRAIRLNAEFCLGVFQRYLDHDDLLRLLIMTLLKINFLKHIRQYDNTFQMTSFGARPGKTVEYMPTFKVHGQVYHLTGSL